MVLLAFFFVFVCAKTTFRGSKRERKKTCRWKFNHCNVVHVNYAFCSALAHMILFDFFSILCSLASRVYLWISVDCLPGITTIFYSYELHATYFIYIFWHLAQWESKLRVSYPNQMEADFGSRKRHSEAYRSEPNIQNVLWEFEWWLMTSWFDEHPTQWRFIAENNRCRHEREVREMVAENTVCPARETDQTRKNWTQQLWNAECGTRYE